jgi:hypothetical protein
MTFGYGEDRLQEILGRLSNIRFGNDGRTGLNE